MDQRTIQFIRQEICLSQNLKKVPIVAMETRGKEMTAPMRDPFFESVKFELDAIRPNLSEQLANGDFMLHHEAVAILRVLLCNGCQTQNDGYIRTATELLQEIPSDTLIELLPTTIDSVLDLGDEWQYRRLLELLRITAPVLLERYVAIGIASAENDIREAASDFDWLVKTGGALRFVYQVSDYLRCDGGVGLLPGVPQALIRTGSLAEVRQGSSLLARRPDGTQVMASIETYTVRVPIDCTYLEDAKRLPIVLVVADDKVRDIPVGSEIYLVAE